MASPETIALAASSAVSLGTDPQASPSQTEMSFKHRSLLGLQLCCVLVCFAAAAGAQESRDKAEKEVQRKQELQKKSYALVDEIATGAHGLKLPENRSFLLTAAADLLWPHDEKRARALFWDAFGSINLMMLPDSNATPKQSAKQKNQKAYFAIFALRQGLLRKVARHDPELALDMLRSARQLPTEQISASFPLPDDKELEQQIATEVATRDPQQALKLARQGLAKGLTFQLLELLDRLNGRDQEVGAKFAGDIIDKIQTRNLSADIFASRIAVDLVTWSREPSAVALAKDAKAARAYQLKLEPERRRQLVGLIADAALGVSANSTLLNSINEIMPEIQEFVPERTALVQRKLVAFEQTLNKEQRGWNEYNTLVRNGSPEDMISASMNADYDEQRRMLRQQAMVVAVLRQRAEDLREFIQSEIKDESLRRNLIDDLDAEQISAAAFHGDGDQLRKLFPRIRRVEERARAMAETAVLLDKNGEHEEAVKLLDEARTLIKVDFESETQTNALFALVAAYAVVEPPKAFAIIERTIDRANDQISKALLLDKIIKTGMVKQGEILLHGSAMISSDLMMFRYGKAVVAMANADFDRTRAAADRFDRTELRLLARLLLAEALLSGDERRTR